MARIRNLKEWLLGGGPDNPPRGAVAVVAVGLFATFAAWLLANENLTGDAAQLEYVQSLDLPDSEPVEVPGGGGEMRLTDVGLEATGTNISGYNLFRAAATLEIDRASPVGSARILCAMRTPGDTEVAQTPELRASYPRSSDNLIDQETYDTSLVEFASKGAALAVVDMEDLPDVYATIKGIKLEWPTYKIGVERWRWFLPPRPPEKELVLPFATVWRATKIPAVEVSCTLTTSAGTATAESSGAMARLPETIAE
jgi:hypothetical protein